MDKGLNSSQLVDSTHVDHPHFTHILDAVLPVVRLGGCGVAPPCLRVTGPSHIGKSRIFKVLKEEFPVVKDGRTIVGPPSLVSDYVPVLFIEPGDKPTEKSLCMDALQNLGDPSWDRQSTNLFLMTKRLDNFLKACGTKAIIIDEAQRFVDRGGKIIGENLLEWLKSRRDNAKVAIILLGLGRLNLLFETDEQLLLRFGAEKRFEPYKWLDEKGNANGEDQANWVGALAGFVKQLGIKIEFEVDKELDAYRFFYAARGRVGRLAKCFEATLRGDGLAVADKNYGMADFRIGYEIAFPLEPGEKNPFGRGFSLKTALPAEDTTEFKTRNPNKPSLSEREVQDRLRKR